MCRVDYADPCDVENRTVRRARKSHECSECGCVIARGETYTHTTILFEGKWDTNKRCVGCELCAEWLGRECEGYCYGGVIDDLREHWYQDGIRTLELGRLVVSANRRMGVEN